MSQPQKFPAGWDQARVQALIDHYDNQTEDEQAAEIEAAMATDGMTLIAVPTDLMPEINRLLAAYKKPA